MLSRQLWDLKLKTHFKISFKVHNINLSQNLHHDSFLNLSKLKTIIITIFRSEFKMKNITR